MAIERVALFQEFVETWATPRPVEPETKGAIVKVEDHFGVRLPAAYREFALNHGAIATPSLSSAISHGKSSIQAVHEFWPVNDVIESTDLFVHEGMPSNLIGFATDSRGNLFGFKVKECPRPGADDAPVWFYNRNINVVHQVAEGFTQWVTDFLKVSKKA